MESDPLQGWFGEGARSWSSALLRQQPSRMLCITTRGLAVPLKQCLVLIETRPTIVPWPLTRRRATPNSPTGHTTHDANMSTAVWPPIAAAELAREQTQSQQRELAWLLVQLKETLQSLKAGLEECAALLAPSENGSTLVLTSVRSESLKGLVTRAGTRIVKGVGGPSLCMHVKTP